MKKEAVAVTIRRTFFVTTLLVGCFTMPLVSAQETASTQAATIVKLARAAMTKHHLKAVILRVTIDGE